MPSWGATRPDRILVRRLLTLPGQTHMVKAKPTTPALLDHFGLAP
jgi:hypothetical protein